MNNYSMFNYVEFELPDDCVTECSASGRVDDAVEFWQAELQLGLDRQAMLLELREYGAWTAEELNDMGNEELEMKMIWLAACDIKDSAAGIE